MMVPKLCAAGVRHRTKTLMRGRARGATKIPAWLLAIRSSPGALSRGSIPQVDPLA